jgi:hypothetical protein
MTSFGFVVLGERDQQGILMSSAKRLRVEVDWKVGDIIPSLQCAIAGSLRPLVLRHLLASMRVAVNEENLSTDSLKAALAIFELLPKETPLDTEFWSTQPGIELVDALSCDRLPSTQGSNYSQLDLEVASEAFNTPFVKQAEIAGPLVEYLNSCCKAWYKGRQYSPYVSLCGPSLIAKSRTSLQVIDWGVFVFSICVRRAKSTGFPRRNKYVSSLLEGSINEKVLTHDCCGLLIVCLRMLTRWLEKRDVHTPLNELTHEWLAHQTDEFWLDVVTAVEQISPHQGSKDARETHYLALMLVEYRGFEVALQSRISVTTNTRRPDTLRVLFAFDEPARLMELDAYEESKLTKFDYLRRSLRIFPESCGLFALLCDTHSSISSLVPPSGKDNSLRACPPGVELFDPFWELDTVDIWPQCADPLKVSDLELITVYSIFGRPGFHAIVQAVNGATELLPLLMSKLVTDPTLTLITTNDALAVLGARTSLHVAAACKASAMLCSR